MGLIIATPPVTTPVSLEQAKRQCRIHESDPTHDALIQDYLDAAIAHLDGPDGILQRALEPQTWDLYLDTFTDSIEIPLRPLLSIDGLSYFDGDGEEQAIEAENFTVDLSSDSGWLVRNTTFSWPTVMTGVNVVKLRFTAGYLGDLDSATYVSAVPAGIRQAILLDVRNMFEPFDDQEAYEKAVAQFLKPFKRIILA